MPEDRSPLWREYSKLSDIAYEKAKIEKNIEILKHHNLLRGGDKEVDVFLTLACSFFEFKIGGAALDLCCGTGYISNCLERRGYIATGVDLNCDAIEIAQSLYSNCSFESADVARPESFLEDSQFNLIVAREAHPFSRINELNYQAKIIEGYLEHLMPGGIFIIAHASRGGGMNHDSLNYEKLEEFLNASGFITTGPTMILLLKKLPIIMKSHFLIHICSKLTFMIQKLFKSRWIEVFIIYKPTNSVS